MVIAALFVIIGYGAYVASKSTRVPLKKSQMASNGTSLFGPTTLLISLDGFRADFLHRNLTPTLHALVNEGISPKYMMPSFPSLTFPNHYTLATGLHPESHGIVANTFWDKHFAEGFAYTTPEHSMQPKWWAPNPIWETAEEQGVRTAIHMWPGSEAHIGDYEPTHLDKYNGKELLPKKAARVLELLDKPGPKDDGASASDPRPQFIAAYVPNIDAMGHRHGPNSTEITDTIEQVDGMLHTIVSGIADRNLSSIVNIIIVSDHGMATTSNDRLIQFESLTDPSLFSSIDGWPHYGLRPKNPEDLKGIHQQLQQQSTRSEGFDVYLRDEDMPERYHFSNNERIAPLWIMPRTGWAIVTKEEYDVEEGQKMDKVFNPRGIHGYDNEDPLMRAIFIARGPAFPHAPGSRVEPFQNTEVYNIVCDSLDIEPAANNGTLRLPLKPVGIHGDKTEVEHETSTNTDNSTAASSVTATPEAANKPSIGVDEPAIGGGSRPVIDDQGAGSSRKEATKARLKKFLQILQDKWHGFVVWVNGHKVQQGSGDQSGSEKAGEGKGGSTTWTSDDVANGKGSDEKEAGAVMDGEHSNYGGGHTTFKTPHTNSGGSSVGPEGATVSDDDDSNDSSEHEGGHTTWKTAHTGSGGNSTGPEGAAKSDSDKVDDDESANRGPAGAANPDYVPPPPGSKGGNTFFKPACKDPKKGPVGAANPDFQPTSEDLEDCEE